MAAASAGAATRLLLGAAARGRRRRARPATCAGRRGVCRGANADAPERASAADLKLIVTEDGRLVSDELPPGTYTVVRLRRAHPRCPTARTCTPSLVPPSALAVEARRRLRPEVLTQLAPTTTTTTSSSSTHARTQHAWWGGLGKAHDLSSAGAPACDAQTQSNCVVFASLLDESNLLCEGLPEGEYAVLASSDGASGEEVCHITEDGAIECDALPPPADDAPGGGDAQGGSAHTKRGPRIRLGG